VYKKAFPVDFQECYFYPTVAFCADYTRDVGGLSSAHTRTCTRSCAHTPTLNQKVANYFYYL